MSEHAFGDLLRRYRQTARLSQSDLAERAGLSVQTIGTLERGTRTHPRRETLLLLAEALGLSEGERETLLVSAGRGDDGRRQPRWRSSAGPSAIGVGAPTSTFVTPRTLPPAVADFTGREGQVAELRSLLASGTTAAAAPAVVVSAIEGMGGVGKTALAVHVAHLLADEFPDGQLYVNLRGFGPGEPMTIDEALNLLLGLLAIPPLNDATGTEQATGRYRSALAGKRALVLLDNAANVNQVLPLIPSTAGCAAIVTSRRSLSSLPGARHLQLDVLPENEAVALLAAIAGEPRMEAEPEAAVALVRRCGHLPLAIRMAGARLVARPSWASRA